MWVFRVHTIGSPYAKCYRKVRQRYLTQVNVNSVLPTHSEMEEWISRKMPDRVHEATFSVQVTQEMIDASTVEDSMDAYYDGLTRGEEVQSVGVRTRKRIKCVVCQSSKFTKIKVSCGHIFHRRCIDEWLRWSKNKECPVCKIKLELKNTLD